MSNILNSKAKLQRALTEVTRRLAIAVSVLEQLKKAPHPSNWSEADREKLKEIVDSAIAEARKDLKV